MKSQQGPGKLTQTCLVDILKQHLASFEVMEGRFDNRKYFNHAHDLLKMGALRPVPYFRIDLSDLTHELIMEIHNLDSQDRPFVLKQAVGRIFEDINAELYHNSISRVLKVKLQ